MKHTYHLRILNFLQFFAWGCWLLSAGSFMGGSLGFSGLQIGSIYSTLGLSSLFMPTLIGIVADRWLSPKLIFSICHFIVATLLICLTFAQNYTMYYVIMFGVTIFYVPTISLNYSLSYTVLTTNNFDVVKSFPPIRVWGTIGFIVAAWCIDLTGWKSNSNQFLLSALASALSGIYAKFTLKPIICSNSTTQLYNISSLYHFIKKSEVKIFLLFSILLGSLLQITNIFGVPFLEDFKTTHPNAFAVKYSVIILSISQISEVIFILAIPSIYKRFGIKWITVISMVAWVFRFALFGISSPEGIGLFFLICSMIIYGMAFDFYNISGSLFIDKESNASNRNAAQGLFAFTTGGLGPIIGGYVSGFIVDFFTIGTEKNWTAIWFVFTGYSLIISVLFFIVFRENKIQLSNKPI